MPQINAYTQPDTHLSKAGLVFATVLAAALSLGALPAAAQVPSVQTPPPRTLGVDGTAEMHVVPDAALVTTGVVTEGETAAATLAANSTALAKVIEAMRSFGIESKDLRTSGLSLTPRYYRPEKSSATDRPRIVGYTATNQVTARVRDLGKLGDLLDKVALAGANRIDGIAFVVSNQEGLLDEARRNAVANAKRKADLYAAAGGFNLGKVMSLTEESGPGYRPVTARAMSAVPAPVAVPIEAGEATLSVRLRVVYGLAD